MDEPIEHPMLGYLLKSVQLQIEDIYKSAREQTFHYDQVRAMQHGFPSTGSFMHAIEVVLVAVQSLC